MPTEFDPAIQSEEIGFRTDELILCDQCGRQNPPNRLECIYCGVALDVRPAAIDKISIRKLESWEPGINLIIEGGNVAKAASLLSVEKEQLQEIAGSRVFLPVARVEDKAAVVLAAKLEELGFACTSIPDEKLAVDKPPVRVAGMRFTNDDLTLIDLNTREEYRHSWRELLLLIPGIFSTGKIDSMEKRRLRKTTSLHDTTTSTDDSVFDLYTPDNSIGYRIQLAGFDYSCLGAQMGPLATGNMARLIDEISSRAPQMRLVDDYKRIRHLLNGIWDIESRKDPTGPKQVGFGKREFGVVHSTSNVEQFTRFSRLQRVML